MYFNRILVVSLLLSPVLRAETNAINEAWEGFSSPDILSSGFTQNFFAPPLEGATYWQGPKNWSSDYWASREGGINLRWNSPRRQGFNYSSPTLAQLKRMSVNQMSVLSPSEKYDILTGRYDYPLKAQVAASVSPEAEEWEGICHGWVVATIHHDEPTPKTLRNADGIAVPFGSADIKALLSYYYAIDQGPAQNVGLRCNFGKWTGGAKECNQDLNAGAFHIILANKLALQNQGIIMDVDRFKEVWNQPVIGYRTQVISRHSPSRNAARSAVVEYRLSTQIFYIEETEPTWNVVHGTSSQSMAQKDLVYRVELNARNEIVGGTWESEERPDFIWQKSKAEVFGGMFSFLPSLLNDSARRNRDPYYRGGQTTTTTTTTTVYEEEVEYEEYEEYEPRRPRRRSNRECYRNYYWNPQTGTYEYRC